MFWPKVVGYSSVFITYSSLALGVYFFVLRLGMRWAFANPWMWIPVLDISLRFFMATWSHMMCMISDPGYVYPSRIMKGGVETCKKCSAVRPERTHHCSVCKACVERMDHHCPWVNNCVGLKNQKAFILFLAYSCSVAVECVILTVSRLVTCPSTVKSVLILGLRLVMSADHLNRVLENANDPLILPDYAPTCDFTIEYALCGIVANILCIFFVIFITFVASDQVQSLALNQTYIETLKGTRGPARTLREAAIETLGMEPSMWWLVPIDWRFSTRSKLKSQ